MIALILEIAVTLGVVGLLVRNAMNTSWRDEGTGTYVGFGIAALVVLYIAWTYFKTKYFPANEAVPEGSFFRWALQGFVFFGAAGWLFRELGKAIGTEGSRKVFRSMPITASFGVLTILSYAFVALFAGPIPLSMVVLVGLGGALFTNLALHFSGNAAMRTSFTMTVVLTIICMAMYFYGGLAPYGEAEILPRANVLPGGNEATGGDPNHILGTDQIGRDILSRLIYGARNTVGIAFLTTVLAFFIGGTFGFLAATLGGWVDQVCSRTVDALMAIPQLIFALLLMTIATAWAGSNTGLVTVYMILIIAVLDSTRVYRLSRAVGLNIVVMDYIEAAKLRGENLTYLIFREILPNATAPLLAEFGLRFCFVFLTIAALSFLGIGIQPPRADWGTMVRDLGQFINFAQFSPLTAALPLMCAGAIALLTVAVNFVVDWMLHRSSGLKE
ncbi:MAG: ABC transporter permease [Pseudomonadota bacterium]